MSRMRETVTTVSTTRDHESNLDALLEDLQTTVSRSNSHLNVNGNVTGYRSIRRTTSDGTPEGTNSEYHIEYLNPANSTQHVLESSYNSANTSAPRSQNKSYKYSAIESSSGGGTGGDFRMKKNISELDSLLDDLNSAQKRNFSESSIVTRNTSGIDPGLLEPATSTPHGSRTLEKHYREEKTLRGRSASPRRDLVFTGNRSRDPSPIQHQTYYEQHEQTPTMQQFYRYEKTTSTRTTGPIVTDVTPSIEPGSSQGTNIRSYNYTEESPLAIRQRSPSPGGQMHSYQYSSSTREVPPSPNFTERVDRVTNYGRDNGNMEFSPSRYPGGKTSSYSYNSSSTVRESRNDAPKTPPPHRSPSPVSFQQPPLPNLKSSDPSHRLTYNVSPPHTVSSYKYSSTTTTTNQYPDGPASMPRPFPAVSSGGSPHEQQPPKQLDELLASFGETDTRHNRYNETTVHHRYNSNNGPSSPPHPPPLEEKHPVEISRSIEKEKIIEKEDSKNVSGPPVYYPPGELFAKKEESLMMQQQSGGGMYKAKGKYEYEAKSKSKVKESSGKAVVPVCLPVCCAMPCSIM